MVHIMGGKDLSSPLSVHLKSNGHDDKRICYPFAVLVEPRCFSAAPLVLSNALEILPWSSKVVLRFSNQNHHCVMHWMNESLALNHAMEQGRLVLSKHDEMFFETDKGTDVDGWIESLIANISWWEELRHFGDEVLMLRSDMAICSTTSAANKRNKKSIQVENYSMDLQLFSNLSLRYKVGQRCSFLHRVDSLIDCLTSHKGLFPSNNHTGPSCINRSSTIDQNNCFLCYELGGERFCPHVIQKPWEKNSAREETCPGVASLRRSQHREPFVLILEPRCYAATPFVLNNALSMLPDSFKVVMFHSENNQHCIQKWLSENVLLQHASEIGRFVLRLDDRLEHNLTKKYSPIGWNSALYVNGTWWEDLQQYGDVVLTMQSDTIICSRNYSMVPWHVNYLGGMSFTHNKVAPSNSLYTDHLNGGFSIRRIEWMLSCIRNYKGEPMVEDSFYNRCTGRKKTKSNSSVLDAMAFSSDSGHSLCFDWLGDRVCPYGAHQPWASGISSNYEELERYCPDLRKLRELQHLL